jgi:gluconolactonase
MQSKRRPLRSAAWAAATLLAATLTGTSVSLAAATGGGARVSVVNAHASYPEGPLWQHGTLYYTEYGADRVMTFRGGVNRQLWKEKGCGANGLVTTVERTFLVACYDNNTLVEINRSGATVRVIRHDSAGSRFHGPNDFTRDARGGIYFSDSGTYSASAPVTGTVEYIARDGSIRVVARHIHYSNGLAVTPDGRHLLVAEMLANRVLRYDIGRNGRLSHRRVFVRLTRIAPVRHRGPLDGPDGVKVDRRGRIYIAQNGAGRVLVVSASGRKLLRTVRVAALHVTNVALGATARTLYITSVIDPDHAPYPGRVYRARLR